MLGTPLAQGHTLESWSFCRFILHGYAPSKPCTRQRASYIMKMRSIEIHADYYYWNPRRDVDFRWFIKRTSKAIFRNDSACAADNSSFCRSVCDVVMFIANRAALRRCNNNAYSREHYYLCDIVCLEQRAVRFFGGVVLGCHQQPTHGTHDPLMPLLYGSAGAYYALGAAV